MRHKVPTGARKFGIGKPDLFIYRKVIGKVKGPSPLKDIQTKNSRTLSVSTHEKVCGKCILDFKECIEKNSQQENLQNLKCSETCVFIFKTVSHLITSCPHYAKDKPVTPEGDI